MKIEFSRIEEEGSPCQGHQQVWIFPKMMKCFKCRRKAKDNGRGLGVEEDTEPGSKATGKTLQVCEQP